MEHQQHRSCFTCGFVVRCVLIIAILSMAVVMWYTMTQYLQQCKVPKSRDPCLDEKCLRTGLQYMQKLNTSANPCQDFYQFACGGWERDRNLNPQQSELNPSELDQILLALVSSSISESDPRSMKLAKQFYVSCMDESRIESLGIQPLLDGIKAAFGEDNWTDNVYGQDMGLTTLLTKVGKLGTEPLIVIGVNEDTDKLYQNIIYLGHPRFNMDPSLYIRENSKNLLEKYTQLYMDLMRQIYGKKQDENEAASVIRFEVQLANVTLTSVGRQYERTTIKDLNKLHPDLNWLEYIQTVLQNARVEIKILETEAVTLGNDSYFVRLFQLLKTTPAYVIIKYCIWQYVYNYAEKTTTAFSTPIAIFKSTWAGKPEVLANRALRCLSETLRYFPLPVGRAYTERHFPFESKAAVSEMIKNILQVFLDKVQKASWITEEAKTGVVRKVDSLNIRVGFPEKYKNTSVLDNLYVKTQMTQNYFGNVVAVEKQVAFRTFNRLTRPVDRDEWMSFSMNAHSYYSESVDQMSFPAVTLKSPLFEHWFSSPLNYGGIGVIIGHEIMNAFDDRGYIIDRFGHIRQWLMKSDVLNFTSNSRCMMNQYRNFQNEEKAPAEGEVTLREVIAEISGLDAAFQVFKRTMQGLPTQKIYPGLQMYAPEQIFFIAFAQSWCRNEKSKPRSCMLSSESESPSWLCVLGSLRNSKDFASTFGCPVGSPMNPVNKCQV